MKDPTFDGEKEWFGDHMLYAVDRFSLIGRSIQALEQLRSDLLSNPTSAPARRYRGSTSHWDAPYWRSFTGKSMVGIRVIVLYVITYVQLHYIDIL